MLLQYSRTFARWRRNWRSNYDHEHEYEPRLMPEDEFDDGRSFYFFIFTSYFYRKGLL